MISSVTLCRARSSGSKSSSSSSRYCIIASNALRRASASESCDSHSNRFGPPRPYENSKALSIPLNRTPPMHPRDPSNARSKSDLNSASLFSIFITILSRFKSLTIFSFLLPGMGVEGGPIVGNSVQSPMANFYRFCPQPVPECSQMDGLLRSSQRARWRAAKASWRAKRQTNPPSLNEEFAAAVELERETRAANAHRLWCFRDDRVRAISGWPTRFAASVWAAREILTAQLGPLGNSPTKIANYLISRNQIGDYRQASVRPMIYVAMRNITLLEEAGAWPDWERPPLGRDDA